jgi:hypothetical protein
LGDYKSVAFLGREADDEHDRSIRGEQD